MQNARQACDCPRQTDTVVRPLRCSNGSPKIASKLLKPNTGSNMLMHGSKTQVGDSTAVKQTNVSIYTCSTDSSKARFQREEQGGQFHTSHTERCFHKPSSSLAKLVSMKLHYNTGMECVTGFYLTTNLNRPLREQSLCSLWTQMHLRGIFWQMMIRT